MAAASNRVGSKSGVEAHTHKYIVTAHLDSKFGISITKKKEIAAMIHTLTSVAEITFLGYHSHIGSQIFDKQAYVAEIEKLVQFTKKCKLNMIFLISQL